MGIGDWAQSPIPILSNNFLKKIKNIYLFIYLLNKHYLLEGNLNLVILFIYIIILLFIYLFCCRGFIGPGASGLWVYSFDHFPTILLLAFEASGLCSLVGS